MGSAREALSRLDSNFSRCPQLQFSLLEIARLTLPSYMSTRQPRIRHEPSNYWVSPPSSSSLKQCNFYRSAWLAIHTFLAIRCYAVAYHSLPMPKCAHHI